MRKYVITYDNEDVEIVGNHDDIKDRLFDHYIMGNYQPKSMRCKIKCFGNNAGSNYFKLLYEWKVIVETEDRNITIDGL